MPLRSHAKEGRERDLGGRTDRGTGAGGNGSVKNSICVSYQLSSHSFLVTLEFDGRTDLSLLAPPRGTRASRLLLRSSSLNDKKMLFGELMVTDMAP